MSYRVIAKNFQSWNELDFEFNDGVTLLKGFNHDDQTSEGSGKSSIVNALCWGLYGKVPEDDVKIDDVIKYGEKHCSVEVAIGHDFIIRSRGPNELRIMKYDGVCHKAVKGKDARETQKMIEELIGMSFETFCQTVYFPQGYNKKFVKASQEDRGKVLSEIQDLSVFDRGYKEAHELIKPEKKKLEDLKHKNELQGIHYNNNLRSISDHQNFTAQQKTQLETQLNSINSTIKDKEDQGAKLQDKLRNFKSEDPAQIEVYQSDIKVLEDRSQEIQGLKSKVDLQLSEVNNNLNNKNRLLSNLKSDNDRINKLNLEKDKLAHFIKNPSQTCPTCGSSLADCDTSHALEESATKELEIQKLYEGTAQLNQQLSGLSESLDTNSLNEQLIKHRTDIQQINTIIYDLREKCKNIDRVKYEYANTQKMFQMIEGDLGNLRKQFEQVSNQEIDDRKEVIHVLQSENLLSEEIIESVNNLIEAANLRISRLENLKQGFKEVKSYTFNSVLKELSRRSNDYLQDLFEVPMSLRFTNDNMKIGLDIKINKIPRSYGLFSGGQQRRIGLSIDLALSDIITSRTGAKLNLFILDEYFKDLSESSMEKCLHLLEKLGKPIVLIEHNSIFNSIVNKTFDIELRDGVSCSTTLY